MRSKGLGGDGGCGGGGGASSNEENSMRVGAGGGVVVAEEHRRWGPVVRPAARAVFCIGSTVCSLSGRGAGTSAVDTSIGPVLLNYFALRVGLP